MKKESIIAIVVGLSVGLVAAMAILFLPRFLAEHGSLPNGLLQQRQLPIRPDKKATLSATTQPAIKQLTILQPEDRLITDKTPLTVKGEAPLQSRIVILALNDQAVTMSDAKGKFKVKLNLVAGRNDIQVAAYTHNDPSPQIKVFKVYYSKKL